MSSLYAKMVVKNDDITINLIKEYFYCLTPGKKYNVTLSGNYYYFVKNDYGVIQMIDKSLFKTIETHRKEILNELGI